MNVQFKKGVLDLCVLALLSRRDRYGYELVSDISKRIDLSEGTIYPLLKRLRDDGLVTTYLEESQEGPPRKYYRLTDAGCTACRQLSEEWVGFVHQVNQLLEGIDRE